MPYLELGVQVLHRVNDAGGAGTGIHGEDGTVVLNGVVHRLLRPHLHNLENIVDIRVVDAVGDHTLPAEDHLTGRSERRVRIAGADVRATAGIEIRIVIQLVRQRVDDVGVGTTLPDNGGGEFGSRARIANGEVAAALRTSLHMGGHSAAMVPIVGLDADLVVALRQQQGILPRDAAHLDVAAVDMRHHHTEILHCDDTRLVGTQRQRLLRRYIARRLEEETGSGSRKITAHPETQIYLFGLRTRIGHNDTEILGGILQIAQS